MPANQPVIPSQNQNGLRCAWICLPENFWPDNAAKIFTDRVRSTGTSIAAGKAKPAALEGPLRRARMNPSHAGHFQLLALHRFREAVSSVDTIPVPKKPFSFFDDGRRKHDASTIAGVDWQTNWQTRRTQTMGKLFFSIGAIAIAVTALFPAAFASQKKTPAKGRGK